MTPPLRARPAPVPLASAVSRWWDDPYTRGAWSLLRVGSSPATRAALGRPFGPVVIAGEATHPEQAGMVHGAYEQGVAAACWCLAEGHRSVAVVGAGAAGAGAARTLADAGVAVQVLEARGRTGGRVWSVGVGGLTVELGANWLQQGGRNPLAPLAEALGCRLVPTDFHTPRVLGAVPDGLTPVVSDAVTDELRRRLEAVGERDVALASVVERFVARPEPWDAAVVQAVVDGEVLLDAGVDLAELSARHGFEPGVGEGDRWVVGGYRQVLDALLEGVPVRLGTPVEHVAWGDDGVTLTTATDTVQADAAIVTVPASVLATGTPAFHPPLPAAHREALAGLTTGRVEKVALVYAERWWPATANGYLRLFGPDPGEVAEWLDLTDTLGVPALSGLFAGPWAARLWSTDDDHAVARAAADALRRAVSAS